MNVSAIPADIEDATKEQSRSCHEALSQKIAVRFDDKKYPPKAVQSFKGSKIWTQVLVSFGVATCQFGMGGIYGYSGVVSPLLTNPNSDDLLLFKAQISLFSSIIHMGTLCGAVIAGPGMTWFGQRRSLLIALPVAMLSWILIGCSPSFGVLIAGRFLSGLVIGVFQSNSHNYIAELALPSIRGKLLAMNELLCQLGLAVSALIGSFGLTWRQQAFLQTPALMIGFLILLRMHDSPRWLMLQKRNKDAYKSLLFYRGESYDIENELQEISDQDRYHSIKMNIRDQVNLMKTKEIFKILCITSFCMFFMHWGGNLIVVAYTVDIIVLTESTVNPYYISTLANTARIFGGFSYILAADKLNRKTQICIPLLLSSVCMVVFGAFFYVQEYYDTSQYSLIPVVIFILYSYFVASSYPGIMSVRGELLPNSVRSLGTSIHFCLLSIGMFVLSFSYPFMIDDLGSKWTFWFFALFALLNFVFIVLFIPETKGKSLEEIEKMQTTKEDSTNI